MSRSAPPTTDATGTGRRVDVRGPRFSAAITTAVLATALVARWPWLVAAQVAIFAASAGLGLRFSPYGALFRVLRDRLGWGPPPATEPEAPPRFAQLCGLLFAGAGLIAIALGATTLGWVLVGVVLGLSALLALTGLCVGCELYVFGLRTRSRLRGPAEAP